MTPHVFPRRGFLRSALAGSTALLAGCSPIAIVNSLVPSDTHSRSANLAYGAHPRHRLDVYQPTDAPRAAPVVVFFYGGNWDAGGREDYRFAGEALASRGFVAVLPDYRLYPEVRFPDFLFDCADAVRWTQANAARFGGDPRRVFLMGHSAGAYNAAMLALDSQYLRDRAQIHGFIGLAGPYDFLPFTSAVTQRVFGMSETPPATQPIHFVSRDDPPALLVTGAADNVVDPGNSVRLAAGLRRQGVAVREIVYPDVGHLRLVGALAAPLRRFAPLLEDVSAFVNERSAQDRL